MHIRLYLIVGVFVGVLEISPVRIIARIRNCFRYCESQRSFTVHEIILLETKIESVCDDLIGLTT